MSRARLLPFASLALLAAAQAAPPEVPATVDCKAGQLTQFEVKITPGKEVGYQPAFPTTEGFFAELKSRDPAKMLFVVQKNKAGKLGVVFWTVGENYGTTVVLKDPGPGPGPDPDPPNPPPDPDPAPDGTSPFKEPGLRFFIVYEKDKLGDLSKGQFGALHSNVWRAYMAENGAKNAKGIVEYRAWDQNAAMTDDTPANFKALMAKPRPSLPYFYVGNGKSGEEGPLPADADAVLKLLQKYKGK